MDFKYQLLNHRCGRERSIRAKVPFFMPDLVDTVKKAWGTLPDKKILMWFEMRRDVATEALANAGWCDSEGKGGGGAKRVHEDASYTALRARLGITG